MVTGGSDALSSSDLNVVHACGVRLFVAAIYADVADVVVAADAVLEIAVLFGFCLMS